MLYSPQFTALQLALFSSNCIKAFNITWINNNGKNMIRSKITNLIERNRIIKLQIKMDKTNKRKNKDNQDMINNKICSRKILCQPTNNSKMEN
jgi:hypothetical protein